MKHRKPRTLGQRLTDALLYPIAAVLLRYDSRKENQR